MLALVSGYLHAVGHFRLLHYLHLIPRCAAMLSLFGVHANAQPPQLADDWRWTEFTTETGLPSDRIHSVLETAGQVPWVFTSHGPAWYDTYVWRRVSFPGDPPFNHPAGMYASAEGQIFITLDSALYSGTASGFKQLPITKVNNAVPLPEGGVLVLHANSRNDKYLALLRDGTETRIEWPQGTSRYEETKLEKTTSGRVWLNADDCLFRWNNGKWEEWLRTPSKTSVMSIDALVESEQLSGILTLPSPYDVRGIWEWYNGKRPTFNTQHTEYSVRGQHIFRDGTALFALEGGNFQIRSGGRWATFSLDRLHAREVQAIAGAGDHDYWIASSHGLFRVRTSARRWTRITLGSLAEDWIINDILLASDNSLWLATGGGISRLTPDGSIRTIKKINGTPLYLTTGVAEDSSGSIWVGSGSGFPGVLRWDGKTWRKFRTGTPLDTSHIHRIVVDSRKRIWCLGVYQSDPHQGPGAFMIERDTVQVLGVRQGMISNRVYAMAEGRDSSLWFGTMEGISRWKSGQWRHWTTAELLSPQRVFTIAITPDSSVWYADGKGVLGVIDKSGTPKRVRVSDGPLSEIVSEIRVDKNGILWCTTPSGLAIHAAGHWFNLDKRIGIINSPLWPVLPLGDSVYVGAASGLMMLHVRDLLHPAPRVFLTEPLTSTNSALMRWNVAIKNGVVPHQLIQTRHKVAGGPWSPWSERREAVLQNLDPGTYEFVVQAKPLLGFDSSGFSTARSVFSITVPVLQDPRVLIPAGSLIGGMLVFVIIITVRNRRIKQRALQEELRREHEHAGRLAELDRMKSQFLANISHEFRTPLTLVLGPIEQLLGRTRDTWDREKLTMARRNAEKLHGFINQLLDFSKVEAGTMGLAVRRGELVGFVKRIVQSFQSWAEQRQHRMSFSTDVDVLEGLFDPDCLEKILNNLISNALKFTPEGGSIRIRIMTDELSSPDKALIAISDSGIGIAPEHLPHIFDRFYRVDESHRTEGTGIGLALTKELVEKHHGSIDVHSSPGKGTEFLVTLPLASFADHEMASPADTEHDSYRPSPPEPEIDTRPDGTEHPDIHGVVVLIVEDSADVRSYIRDYLVSEYTVIEARDGAEGLEKACTAIPDIIVSDIMMPKMNGFELCREIKSDERTSHIPVILLTARSGMENKIEGLETGADDYLTKPFNAQELLARINNLIESRRRLREKFSRTIPLKPGEVAVSSLDDAFLRKAVANVEQFMTDEAFDVERFSHEMAMSRMQLHRKLRALTGYSATQFIRYLRLMRAQELLKKDAGNVADIAYQTGFGSPTYFSRCYHEHFGCTPGQAKHQFSSER